jgi:Tfp pilus assembly protein PilO
MVTSAVNPHTRYKLVMLLLVSSFVAIIFCLYNIQRLALSLKNIKVNIAESKRDIILIDKVTNERSQYINDINNVKSTLPSKYFEIAYFTSQLETLAELNSLAIQTSIDQKSIEETDTYSSISYSLILNGSFSSVSSFLSQLLKLPYNTYIDNLKMSIENEGLVSHIKIKLFIEK